MRTIYFVSCEDFPRAGAVSNYIQYFVCALAEAGYNVKLLVRNSGAQYEYFNNLSYVTQGQIEILELPAKEKVKNVIMKIRYEISYLKKISGILSQQCVGNEDLVITYISLIWYLIPIIGLRRKSKCKLAACPVEHFPKEHFKGKLRHLQYVLYHIYYNWYLPNTDMCFAISTRIKKSIIKMGGNATVVPIMADTTEYSLASKENNEHYNVIFPANGMMKDSLCEMLEAIIELEDSFAKKMTFHICGVKKRDVLNIIGNRKVACDKLVIHDWMEYDELVNLYRRMHYLFLARPVNLMTESNFPSKIPEVMTHGVVPIVSRVGDYTDFYLQDGVNSLVFDGCSKKSCSDALKRALSTSYESYMMLSDSARTCACARFDYHNWSEHLRKVIEEDVFNDL